MILNKKGYFLNRSQTSMYSAFVVEVVRCDLLPWAIGDVLGQHGLSQHGSLVFCAFGAPSDVIGNVIIDAGPIICLSCLCLHLLHPLVCSVEVSKGVVKEFWGNTDLVSLQENTGLEGQLILDTPEVSGKSSGPT